MNKDGIKATNRVSVKRKSISIYLPTDEMVDRWKRLAEKAGLSLSQYVQDIVEDHIKKFEETIDPNDLGGQIEKIKELINYVEKQQSDIEKQQSDMEKQIKMIRDRDNRAKERLEEGIREEIIKAFREGDIFEGIREYDAALITLLKKKGVVKEDELMDLLHIDHDDTESVKIVNQQLDNLLGSNLIKRSNGNIIWVK